MSANNYILIKENKRNFKIMEMDADTRIQLGRAQKAYSLKEAVQKAQDRLNWEDVEYGIHFDLRKDEK